MPKVSIIVPIYNVECFIKKCVNSIQKQDFTDIEIILVDDGSPDNSGKIIDELACEDKRIKVVHKPNEGVSIARNTGLDMALGDYIVFVDGDDYIEPTCVSDFLQLIEKNNADVALSYHFLRDDEINKYDYNIRTIDGETACKELYLNKTGVAVWNKIYRREFLNSNHLRFHSEYWFAEGMTFNIECFIKCKKIAVMEKALYHQTSNANSAVRKFNLESWYCGRRAMEYQRALICKLRNDIINAWNYHYRQYNYSILCGIIKSNTLSEYSEEMKKCIRGLRKNVDYALKVDIGIKSKIKSIIIAMFPLQMARRDVKKELSMEK